MRIIRSDLTLTGILFFTLLTAACQSVPPATVPEPAVPASSAALSSAAAVEVIAKNLSVPWDIAFLPGGDLLVTERKGILLRIGNNQQRHVIQDVHEFGEGGLLGIALHPQFEKNQWIYLYLTTEVGEDVKNRVDRYRLENDQLLDRTLIVGNIPGAIYHDGGRMAFGPDGYLYITTGDATDESLSQNTASPAGKILRIRDDGSIPSDNPFGNAVYSYGHRNPQGLTWDDQGRLWSTEHGRSGAASGYDELNLIEKGGNYGWPVIQGSESKESMRTPILHSGPKATWAPASALFYDGSIFFGGLRGEALYEAAIPSDLTQPVTLRAHLRKQFGRIRTVKRGPDGSFFLTTSNRDGRGKPVADDDRIVRIDPTRLP